MRNSVYILSIFLLLIGLIGSMIKFNFDVENLKYEFVCERALTNKQVEELEKEIRILKTDIDVIQYGFQEDRNVKQN